MGFFGIHIFHMKIFIIHRKLPLHFIIFVCEFMFYGPVTQLTHFQSCRDTFLCCIRTKQGITFLAQGCMIQGSTLSQSITIDSKPSLGFYFSETTQWAFIFYNSSLYVSIGRGSWIEMRLKFLMNISLNLYNY